MTVAVIWSIVGIILTFGAAAAANWLGRDIKRTREALLAKAVAAAKTPTLEDDATVAAETLAAEKLLMMEELALAAANEGSVAKVIHIVHSSSQAPTPPAGVPRNEVGTPRKPKT